MKAKHAHKAIAMLLIPAITIIMISCASTAQMAWSKDGEGIYQVSINSYGNYNLDGKTYYIESGDEIISSNDLEFKEYADYLKKDLAIHGAKDTFDKENADMCILLNYGLVDESYQESIPVPEYGRTTIASMVTNGSVTRFNYNYGTTGYHYEQKNVSKYIRIVNIYAYDNKKRDSEPIMLWKTNIKSAGSSNDLQKAIPHMLCASAYYMGKKSEGEKTQLIHKEGHLFNCWKQNLCADTNFYYLNKRIPSISIIQEKYMYDKEKDEPRFYIKYVRKLNNETIVCLTKTGQLKGSNAYYSISPNLFLKCEAKEVQISHVDNYSLGTHMAEKWEPLSGANPSVQQIWIEKHIENSCGEKYFILHFPINLGTANSFNIIEHFDSDYTRCKSWGTVELNRCMSDWGNSDVYIIEKHCQ